MKWILVLIAFFIFIILLVTPSITNKYYDLAKRFRMLEEKTDSYGRYLASNLETYQKTRKPIRIYSKLNDNIRFNWKELEVPWDKSQFSKIKALEVWNDNLVVGLLGNTKGSISIYIYDEKKWIQLLGVENNFIKEWEKLNYVQVLKVHNEKLYAGINNTVWMLDEKNKWVPVGVNKENSYPWGDGIAYSMASYNDYLYLGITGKASSVYRLNKSEWEKVSLGLDEHANQGIYELLSHSDGKLYATNVSTFNSTVVYQFDEKNIRWNTIGGKGINDSWISNGFTHGLSLSSHKESLFITMNRHPNIWGKFSSVWAYDDNKWFAIGNKNPPKDWNEIDTFNASISFKNMMFIGVGGSPAGNSSVWVLDKNQWVLIGGKGVNNSWGLKFPHTMANNFRHTVEEYVYRFVEWNDSLIVGFGEGKNISKLWRLSIGDKR